MSTNDPNPTIWPIPQLAVGMYRCTLELHGLTQLPPDVGSTLRGLLGAGLKRIACVERTASACPPCALGNRCPYGAIFEPTSPFPTGEDVPGPLVIEPPDGRRMLYRAGEQLIFNIVLIGRGNACLPYLVLVLNELAERGLGERRAPFVLQRIEALNPLTSRVQEMYRDGTSLPTEDLTIGAKQISDYAARLPEDALTIEFLTPARLSYHSKYIVQPIFAALAGGLARRVNALAIAYGMGSAPLELDSLLEAAEHVQLAGSDLRWVQQERFSVRQRKHTSLAGIMGTARYVGALGPFRQLLTLGMLVHCGKGAVFGNGRYRLSV